MRTLRYLGVVWTEVGDRHWLAKINDLAMSLIPDKEYGWVIVCSTAGHFGTLKPKDGSRPPRRQAMREATRWAQDEAAKETTA